MGTSGAWGGTNSADGQQLRDNLARSNMSSSGSPDPIADPTLLRPAVRLLDTTRSPGKQKGATSQGARRTRIGRGGASSGGGAQRSNARTARSAARALTGAIAYRGGDRAALRRLGLDFDESLDLMIHWKSFGAS